MTAEFHNTIYLHGPHQPETTWTVGSPGWSSIRTSGATIIVHTVPEADALILAAVAAKDLLLAAQEPPPLSRDLSGDLDAIPPHRIGEPAPLPGGAS